VVSKLDLPQEEKEHVEGALNGLYEQIEEGVLCAWPMPCIT
jgi:hypothetical protein